MSASTPRNLLLVTYEFPPSAGGGVQRVAKLARYLPEDGWRVRVLTAEPIEGRPRDDTLLEGVAGTEVVRLPARNVALAIARTLAPLKRMRRGRARAGGAPGTVASASSSAGSPLSTRIARWIAVPDAAVLWAREVLAAAERMHAREPFDAVLASGPPYSGVAAASRVARRLGIPLLVDMRDAWIANPSVHWPTPLHARRSEAIARRTIRNAAGVLAVSEPIAEEARDLGANRVLVLPNGFDPRDLPPRAPDPDGPLRLAFMGRLYGVVDPETLIEGIRLAVENGDAGPGFSVDVVGPPAPAAEGLVKRAGLEAVIRFLGFKPHAEALKLVGDADAAVVSIGQQPGSEGVYSGKLFEYLGLRVPVLLIAPPDGVASRLVAEARSGWVTPSGNAEALAATIARLSVLKREGRLRIEPDEQVLARYDRRAQARQVSTLLGELTSPTGTDSEVRASG